MKTKSLAFRLVVSSAIWSLLVLGVAGLLLSSNYRTSIEKSFDERLQIHLKAIVAEIEIGVDKELKIDRSLGDSRFDVPYSGWYWQIIDSKDNVSLSSKSLFDAKLDIPSRAELENTSVNFAYISGPENQGLRAVSRSLTLPGFSKPHVFTVAGDGAEIEEAVSSFVRILSIGMLSLAVGILVALFLQIRFGLQPLKRLEEGLGEIRSGSKKELHGAYPSEISPLVSELNSLLKANRELVERARTHVGNLAHSLKTPLSVLSNEVDSLTEQTSKDKMHGQIDKMRNQVSHHLDRAQMAARTKTFGLATPVKPVAESIFRALNQINRHKNLVTNLDMTEEITFAGEKQDLEEIIGNVLENAFKFTDKSIDVQITPLTKNKGSVAVPQFQITIRDDGKGLSDAEVQEALLRGKRFDESKPGSGLGLSIVSELVEIYQGELHLDTPKTGGLRVKINLPSIN